MAQSYADAVKKSIDEGDRTENMEADLVTDKDRANSRSRSVQPFQVDFDDQKMENHDATLLGSKPEIQDEPHKKARGQGGGKVSRRTIALSVAVDIALAGILVRWVFKRPSINKINAGLGAIGLSCFYGFQCKVFTIGKRKRKSKEKSNGEMSQMPEGDDDYGYDPMNMDEYDDGQLDGTAGPSYNPQSSYGIREAGGYDEGFFSGPVHQQHHKGGHHHRQNQQSDKTVDQDFFNDFPDDFDDEDLK
ncbi:13572_t:CDS:2 [Dentiscutata erythropus]|uniref:13572_t:CDS:1 n=1 Tax=Dentiscutata erythropus TaxID=1348616 RepID=A0A9N9GN32_9GLOM|nr:13572_t:CDS:2 [Dentiscutata erythropus]